MPRYKISRDLPSLREVFPRHRPYPRTQSRQQLLLNDLRAACKRLRKTKSQIFYTMRDLTVFFKVPLRTVALVYEELEKEGLLNRIRGSHTLLTGRKSAVRFPVRGVIGLPIWLDSLVVSAFTRRVNMDLENKLREQGYVADLIFHVTKQEEALPDFAERLLKHNLDAVVWQNPHPQSEQNILSLHEHGVRVLVIQTMEAKTDLPAVTYLQDWRPGYRALAERWRAAGVEKVWVAADPEKLHYRSEIQSFTRILEESGLSFETWAEDIRRLPQISPSRKSGKRMAVAFLDTAMADRLCNREPVAIEKLSHFSRLAFCRGPIGAPYLEHRGVLLEMVAFSAVEIATKIAEDIQILPGVPPGIRHLFEAKDWPQGEYDRERLI